MFKLAHLVLLNFVVLVVVLVMHLEKRACGIMGYMMLCGVVVPL